MGEASRARKRFVVGITGASGAVYAQRLCTELVRLGHELHIVVTNYGKRLLRDELAMEGINLHTLCGLDPGEDPRELGIHLHPTKDVGASLGSGSFRHDGMVILPCSSNTLGAIASGYGNELLTRAAACALKERMKLVICHRESPLNLIDIRNMERLTLAGAVIAPTNPGFYMLPETLDDIVNFVVGRVMDVIGVESELNVRWVDHRMREE